MELAHQLLTGAVAGMLAGLIHFATAPFYASIVPNLQAAVPTPGSTAQLAALAIHPLAGLGLGLLFWLSWGLTAVVGVPWWQRGLAFASVLWLVGCLPVLAAQTLRLRIPCAAAIVIASEWLLTLALVGLACAWTWHHGP